MYKIIKIIILSNSRVNLIQIFDIDNILIEEVYTKYDCYFNVLINKNYKLRIITNNNIINTNLYVNKEYNRPYVFNMINNIYHKIFIKIIDKNYSNLKIEKGELILWKKS